MECLAASSSARTGSKHVPLFAPWCRPTPWSDELDEMASLSRVSRVLVHMHSLQVLVIIAMRQGGVLLLKVRGGTFIQGLDANRTIS